jgi:hypothetical protein
MLSSCGFASVSPFVSGADVAYDPKLVGTWVDPDGKESAVIVREGDGYDIAYTEDSGKIGRFHGVLGGLGSRRVLDVFPKDLPNDRGDLYRSLLMPTHGIIVVEAIDNNLTMRTFQFEEIKKLLAARPSLVAHVLVKGGVEEELGILLTAPTADVRKFVSEIIDRPGVLEEPDIWRRK